MDAADGSTPLQTCRKAVEALAQMPGWRLLARSRWYRTVPVPPLPGAPPFVNGAALLGRQGELGETDAPTRLLAALHALEDAAGRVRPFPDAPRTLDLDLISMDDLRRAAPPPILPHPRAHLRRFVLQPLAEVWPGWRHPILGRTVEDLMAELPETDPPEPIPE